MRTFEDSQKSKKTVASMIEGKKDEKKGNKGKENKVSKGIDSILIFGTQCFFFSHSFPHSWPPFSVSIVISF